VMAMAAFVATGSAVANPVFGGLTKVMVPDEQLSAASSLQQGGQLIATLAGPPLGGLLYGWCGGAGQPLLIAAGAFLAITAAGLLIRTRRRPDLGEDDEHPASAGMAVLFGDQVLFAVVVLAVLIIVLGTAVAVAEPLLVLGVYHTSAVVYGLLGATWTLGMLAGTAYASRLDSVSRILVGIPTGAVTFAVSFVLIGLINSLVAVFLLMATAGAGAAVSSVATGTLLLLRAPEATVGRVLASYAAITRAAGLISTGLGGLIVGLLAPQMVFLLCGVLVLLAVLANAPRLARARRAHLSR
jgi:MFS family permease